MASLAQFAGINVNWSEVPVLPAGAQIVEFAGQSPPDPKCLPHNKHVVTTKQSFAEALMQPGTGTQPHSHKIVEETYAVQMGTGTLLIADNATREFKVVHVDFGDVVIIPANHSHHIFQTGHKPLSFGVTAAPPWTLDCHEPAEPWFMDFVHAYEARMAARAQEDAAWLVQQTQQAQQAQQQ